MIYNKKKYNIQININIRNLKITKSIKNNKKVGQRGSIDYSGGLSIFSLSPPFPLPPSRLVQVTWETISSHWDWPIPLVPAEEVCCRSCQLDYSSWWDPEEPSLFLLLASGTSCPLMWDWPQSSCLFVTALPAWSPSGGTYVRRYYRLFIFGQTVYAVKNIFFWWCLQKNVF